MTASFAAGAALMPSLPFLALRLLRSARHHDGPPIVPVDLEAGGLLSAGTVDATCTAPPPVRLVVEGRSPDSQPDVTPPMAKAGGVRRPDAGPPCHRPDCRCCRVYAVRQHEAHLEIDRLREELVRADGRRINASSTMRRPGVTSPFTSAGGQG